MKFRTDFVTNSSSNSYCVSLRVNPNNGKSIGLNLFPDSDEFGDNSCDFSLKSEVKDVINKIKNCQSIEELTHLLILESICGAAGSFLPWDIKKRIIAAERSDDIIKELDRIQAGDVLSKIQSFKSGMESLSDLADVKSVTIHEEFAGWGEFAYDTLENFMRQATPPNTDWESLSDEEIRELFGDDIFEDDLNNLIDALNDEVDGINPNGDIYTTVFLSDGSVEKSYDIML